MHPWYYYHPDPYSYYFPPPNLEQYWKYSNQSPLTKNQEKIKKQVKMEEEQHLEKDIIPPSKLIFSAKKIYRRKKQDLEDDEYEEDLQNELKDETKKEIRQNKARNFYSTIFRIFLRKICNEKYSKLNQEEVLKSIKIANVSISLDEVMRILHRKNKLLKSYIRVKDIKRFFLGDDLNPGEENEESYVVLRMLMQRYLRKDFFMHYTLSKNIRDGNSALYLSTARKFIYLFLQK